MKELRWDTIMIKRPGEKTFSTEDADGMLGCPVGTTVMFNACNWSGETKTLKITGLTEFSIKELGCKFKFVKNNYGYDVLSADGQWDNDHILCRVYAPAMGEHKDWFATAYCITREARHPMLAAATLLLNII